MFRFKQFSVNNDGTAFKVGTDAVLLGASVCLTGTERRILDAGTGTGIIALMIAQRLSALGNSVFAADAIDADAASAAIAAENFAASPWAPMLNARHLTLSQLEEKLQAGVQYDLIVSNPPYFENSLKNPDGRKSIARHSCEDGLSWRTLLDFAAEHLAPGGRLAMILPVDIAVKAAAAPAGLGLWRRLSIKTSPSKPVTRVILEFGKGGIGPQKREESLTVQENGLYTPEYLLLTEPFHLFGK